MKGKIILGLVVLGLLIVGAFIFVDFDTTAEDQVNPTQIPRAIAQALCVFIML